MSPGNLSAPAEKLGNAVIFGCAGTILSPAERRFFTEADPFGFILFGRNCRTPEQIALLVEDLRATVGRPGAPVLIDQEGGRVARLRPPHWRLPPAGRVFAELYRRDPAAGLDAAWLNARLIADDLHRLGIDVDCAPVLDVPVPGAHDIIGDRALGDTPAAVAALGRAQSDGLLAGGVLPVIKHIPGHGRAGADSHLALPVVAAGYDALAASDFAAFRLLADAPLAMTAHVVYSAIDPLAPASTSARVVEQVIRGAIGFDNLLLSDDIGMAALAGSFAQRAAGVLAAGCDLVLHCSGDAAEMHSIMPAIGPLQGRAAARAAAALACRQPPETFDRAAGKHRLDRLLGMGEAV